MIQIGPSVTNNSLRIKFALKLGKDFQYPYRMNFTTKIIIIYPCLTNNVVVFCKPWRQNIIESDMWIKSKYLQTLSQLQPILISIHLQSCRVRIGQGMVSYYTASRSVIKPPIIKVTSITECCERRMECLSASINFIAHKIDLDTVPTRNPSRKA